MDRIVTAAMLGTHLSLAIIATRSSEDHRAGPTKQKLPETSTLE